MTLGVFGHDFAYEMECIVRLFFPGNKINTVNRNDFTDTDFIITQIYPAVLDKQAIAVNVRIDGFDRTLEAGVSAVASGELLERKLGAMLFNLLVEKTGKRPQWGILTGIRPVRLCDKWSCDDGLSDEEIFMKLTNGYLVSPKKAELCLKTYKSQAKILKGNTKDSFSLYISVPFCPARCLYCSFVSYTVEKDARLVPEYVRLLCEEIAYIGEIAKDFKLILKTVYIGGGTPTILSPSQLEEIFRSIEASFDMSGVTEYTVEAGRPDTVTVEKLSVMRAFGVNRISINPQSMNAGVLKAIGRRHGPEEIHAAMELSKQAGFPCINMDVIAGLPSETMQGFTESIEKVIGFTPQNITVHTLTVKRSSNMRGDVDAFLSANLETGAMLDYAIARLAKRAYLPYYLYKQKAAVQNLENIGFSIPGFLSAYNIYSMHDTHTIFAAGAGAVSKICFNESIDRIFNYKYPSEYIKNFKDVIKRKGALYATNHPEKIYPASY